MCNLSHSAQKYQGISKLMCYPGLNIVENSSIAQAIVA